MRLVLCGTGGRSWQPSVCPILLGKCYDADEILEPTTRLERVACSLRVTFVHFLILSNLFLFLLNSYSNTSLSIPVFPFNFLAFLYLYWTITGQSTSLIFQQLVRSYYGK